METCKEHSAYQEHFDRVDARLLDNENKIDRHDRLIERQIALMETQQCTNSRLETNMEKQDDHFSAIVEKLDGRIIDIESQPRKYFDIAVGALITGVVGMVLYQIGILQ